MTVDAVMGLLLILLEVMGVADGSDDGDHQVYYMILSFIILIDIYSYLSTYNQVNVTL